jgi:hypothetical protein
VIFYDEGGVACALMALKWDGKYEGNLKDLIEIKHWTRALWTVDIFCLLREFEMDVIFFTTCIGTASHHSEILWYSNNITEDAIRIRSLFEMASRYGWPIHEVSFLWCS